MGKCKSERLAQWYRRCLLIKRPRSRFTALLWDFSSSGKLPHRMDLVYTLNTYRRYRKFSLSFVSGRILFFHLITETALITITVKGLVS